MGTAEGSAGLGDILFLSLREVFLVLRGDAVGFAQPPAEVDLLAAGAAKRQVGQLGQRLSYQLLFTDRAGRLYHRPLSPSTWGFLSRFSWASPPQPAPARRTHRLCRSCRRAWR